MAELEQVEKLREKANVSFAEAKEALDASNGDMLDALIYLENQGKATVPAGGGFFTSNGVTENGTADGSVKGGERKKNEGETFWEMIKRFFRFCIRVIDKGNNNFLEAYKNSALVFSVPVTVVVLLVMFCFYVTVPLFVISLFCGLRYRFRGAELGNDAVNKVMDNASDVVEDVKKSFSEGDNK